MITNLDPSSEYFLAAAARTQRRVADANLQVASGKRVNAASDAPDDISDLLQLKADLRHNTRIQSNLELARTDASAADRALDSSIKLVERALVLANQAGNPGIDDAGRQSIAQEVRSIQEQMVAYSRTSVQGRFLFSGDQNLSPPYEFDATAPSGVVQLNTAPATVRVEDASGGSFAASKTAQEIFDLRNSDGTVAAGNVFDAINSLRLALQNNDTSAINSSITALHSASDHLNSMQAFYGSVQNRIDAAASFASSHDIELHSELSQKEDADIAAAIIEVTQASTQLQAAFQMRSLIPRRTLFDYLV